MSLQEILTLFSLGLILLAVLFFWNAGLLAGRYRTEKQRRGRFYLGLTGFFILFCAFCGLMAAATEGEIASSIIIVVSILIFWVAPLLLLILLQMRSSNRQSLAWLLATTAEKEIPLQDAAIAFSDEHNGYQKANYMAALLQEGATAHDAVKQSMLRLPIDARLAVDVGSRLGIMGPCMRPLLEDSEDVELTMREAIEKLWYLMAVPMFTTLILTFVMIRIVPVYGKMFADFGRELPAATAFLITASAYLKNWLPILFLPGTFVAGAILFAGALYYVGLMPVNFPLLGLFARRLDGARLLRVLGASLERKHNLEETLRILTLHYPRHAVRKRLERAGLKASQGVHWTRALCESKLITPAEATVLQSAERTGNLSWTMNELAAAGAKRFAYRARMWLSIAFPIVVFGNGSVVLCCAIGLLTPLAALILGVS